MKKSNYRNFLESKIVIADRHGFDVGRKPAPVKDPDQMEMF